MPVISVLTSKFSITSIPSIWLPKTFMPNERINDFKESGIFML